MSVTDFLLFVLGMATSGALVALILLLYPRMRLAGDGPARAAVENALQPFVAHAIMASFRLSETEADAGMGTLTGAEKKELADSAYRLLPERIGEFEAATVKALVPPDRFRALVQDAFDRFDRFYLLHHAHFDEAYRARKAVASAGAPGRGENALEAP